VNSFASTKPKYYDDPTKLDADFLKNLHFIEHSLNQFTKHEKIRIELWLKKLCQVTTNVVWKANRNLYTTVLVEMINNKMVCPPFTHVPPEGPLPRYKIQKFSLI